MPKGRSSNARPRGTTTAGQRSHPIEEMELLRAGRERQAHGKAGDPALCRSGAQSALDAILRDLSQQKWPRRGEAA
jgi:hypothetical protein